MNFDRINEQLHKIKTTKKIEDIHTLVGFLVESFGVMHCNPEELFMHASVQREVSRFMSAQGFRNQAAAYTIPHQSGIPLDIKLFWMKKTTKANLSWVMALTPNYEDNPETNENLNIGMDIIVSENCDSVFVVLSNNLKARVLELNGSLSLTQKEIFNNWVKIRRTTNRESENFKKEFHALLWKSFDFEPINRKFYLQLVEQFDHLVGHITKTITDQEKAKMFAVRLIGRTLFLWFLRKKEFVNHEFDYFTVLGDADQTEYYREKLEPLFFEVLNTEIKDRSFADKITPFLNGGLFEPIDTDFYKDSKLTFPTGFFTQFFNVLNHYNFTVDEGTSEYEQVAVDPEMLGRVFENLLASLNDETGNQARKSKGAFYTPREIVDYMCEQSLVEYLKTKLPDTANRDSRIEELVTMDEASFREQDHNKRRDWKKDLGQEQVVQALDELKILDPAVGSGAFPMGMLNLLVKVYTRIDTAREKDLAQLKRDILSRSLYGVDIDQMAIQISRLRAWLSILVDMENLKKAEPLPNLDFKFVCANTLIPLTGLDATNLFDETDLKQDLINIRDAYYSENRKSFKKKLRDQYLGRIKDGGLFAELESERQRQLKDYNPFNPLNSSGFYDSTLMHGVEAFDVVIGNPPYVNVEKISKEIKNKIQNFVTAFQKYDLYVLFYEKGINLLNQKGILSYITSNKFLSQAYGTKLRQELLKYQIIDLVNFNFDIFENATVRTCVLIIKKELNEKNFINIIDINSKKDTNKFNKLIYQKLDQAIFRNTTDNNFRINLTISKINLLNKIENESLKVEEICSVNYGLRPSGKTDGSVKKDYIQTISTNQTKPYFEGKNMGYWLVDEVKYLVYKPDKMYNPMFPELFERPKLVGLRTLSDISKLRFIYDDKQLFCNDSVVILTLWYLFEDVQNQTIKRFISDEKITNSRNYTYSFLQGILNSKLIKFYFNELMYDGTHFYPNQMKAIPIKIKNDDNNIITVQIEELVNKILQNKSSNKTVDISDLESRVDELVMDLYGLNQEEKEIIRNS